MSFVVFRCRNCGIGIEIQPDNLLTICAQCGSVYPSKKLNDVPIHIVPSHSEDDIRACVKKRMANDDQMQNVNIKIDGAEGIYVPLYINQTTVKGSWRGYRNRKKGKHHVKEWHDGTIEQTGDFPVLGRNHAHQFGIEGLGRMIFSQKPVPFEDIDWKNIGMPVLSVDVDEAQATLAVEDDLIDLISENIVSGRRLKAITEFNATVTIQSRFILLYPLWMVTYTHKKGSYRVAVGGGKPAVLAAMEPVFMAKRIQHIAIGALGIVGTGGLWGFGWMLLAHSSSDDAGDAFIAVILGIAACFWMAWRTAKKLVSSVQIERIGKSGEVLS